MLWLIWKYLDAGKDWRQEEKGMAEDEMVGWHHWLNEDEFEQALGVGDGQGSLECCGPWDLEELNTIKWLNWTDISINIFDKKKLSVSMIEKWKNKLKWKKLKNRELNVIGKQIKKWKNI